MPEISYMSFPHLPSFRLKSGMDAMKECELVVSATASRIILSGEKTYSCYIRLQFWILASPRDVETAIGRNPQALLINLDSLNEIVETNRKQQEELVQKGQRDRGSHWGNQGMAGNDRCR